MRASLCDGVYNILQMQGDFVSIRNWIWSESSSGAILSFWEVPVFLRQMRSSVGFVEITVLKLVLQVAYLRNSSPMFGGAGLVSLPRDEVSHGNLKPR